MTRDPLYQRIVAGLGGSLDPESFERCAADLLRRVYPGLAPVRGGNDAGMDGAVGDGDGPAFPLVCTTAANVLRNLRGSLQSYLDAGGTRRVAVLATSQALTPRRRRALEHAASGLGFTLANIHDRSDFANGLYRDPKWCVELLNLPHDPAPLSALPRTLRPLPSGTLVGRDEDLDWLRRTPGDLLLVGQPGTGKTALLAALALAGEGLFVVTEDVGRVLAGVREFQPPALLVDDAHLVPGLLAELRRQRQETGASFRIIADCWQGEREAVARAMGVSTNSVRELERLPRAQIVEVIRDRGLDGNNALVREIARQADGRPGLAVTLCDVCLRENSTGPVALGDALAGDVRATFEPLVGRDAISILAGLALGGGSGMQIEDVAEFLGLPLVRLHEAVSRLAAGGVLAEAGWRRVVVRPEALRHALVRDTFFNGPAALPVNRLLARAPADEATRTLIGARARGARIPFADLATRVRRSGDDKVWDEFASLGPAECRWVLVERGDDLHEVGVTALQIIPEEAVVRLFAVGVQPNGEWALTLLDQWAKAGMPGSGEPVSRRRLIAREATRWLEEDANSAVAIRAYCAALAPGYQAWEQDVADRYRMIQRYGHATLDEMRQIQTLWPGLRDRLHSEAITDWQPLQELYRAWAFPMLYRVAVDADTVAAMSRFASEVLFDLVQLCRDRPGFIHWAWQMADTRGLSLPVSLDPDFEALYPFRHRPDWQAAHEELRVASVALAERWVSEPPAAVAARISGWEVEIEAARSHAWPRGAPLTCEHLARLVDDPGVWTDAFAAAGLPGEMVGPFLAQTVALGRPGWEGRLEVCLESPKSEQAAVCIILGLADPPPHLLRAACDRLPRFANLVLVLAGKQTSVARVRDLLRHSAPVVAGMAAMGEWHSEPVGVVRPALAADWRDAVVRGVEDVPDAIWEAVPGLARDWLQARFDGPPRTGWPEMPPYQKVFDMLSVGDRAELLGHIPGNATWAADVVRLLVGNDVDLFRRLLGNDLLAAHAMAPLASRPDTRWREMAAVALSAGIEPERIALAAFDAEWVDLRRMGPMRWDDWPAAFAILQDDADPQVRKVGHFGREEAERRIEEQRQERRREAAWEDG